jgi:hypothetical protein
MAGEIIAVGEILVFGGCFKVTLQTDTISILKGVSGRNPGEEHAVNRSELIYTYRLELFDSQAEVGVGIPFVWGLRQHTVKDRFGGLVIVISDERRIYFWHRNQIADGSEANEGKKQWNKEQAG